MQPLKIAVLYGGKSTEHEVSVHSAQTVCRLLSAQKDKYTVFPIFISRQGHWFLQTACSEQTPQDKPLTPCLLPDCQLISPDGSFKLSVDVFFPVLHGTNGEDGVLQGLLESINTPYVGCGVLASAMGMDKEITKLVAQQHGVAVLPYQKIRRGQAYDRAALEAWAGRQGYPVFVKPMSLGSSVGVTKVKTAEELHPAIEKALAFDEFVLVEKGVDNAREIFCALYGRGPAAKASSCGELKMLANEFFDYEAKYLVQGGCETRVPADIPPAMQEQMQRDALTVFSALRACGLARVDFLLGKDGKYYFSEINTLPGMSETSLFPQLFEASGYKYTDILDGLIQIALQVHQEKARLQLNR